MIKIIRSNERYHADRGWLSTYWLFAFDEYYDPANTNWGPLRVFNDDTVQPGQGFGSHGHRDMEIITYGLEGELEHRDSEGNRGVIRPGEVQVMSAGKGIVHSEFNHSTVAPVHFLQLWILPRARGRTPRWEQRRFARPERTAKLLPVVSSGNLPETLAIDQDATIFTSFLPAGQEVKHESEAGRKAYLYVISGGVSLNGNTIQAGDQARLANEPGIVLRATADTELILLDLPA